MFEGRCPGMIDLEERGSSGFGYDPLFVPDGYAKTFAEMALEEKREISHRGRALRALAIYLTRAW
jgi:XTP/dITP diphosphohydrolase